MGCVTTGGNGSIEKGTFCDPKDFTKIMLFDQPTAIDIASLQQKAFVEALLISSIDKLTILSDANYYEPTVSETSFFEPEHGSKLPNDPKPPSKKFKFLASECLKRTLKEWGGITTYAMIVSTKDYLQGLPVENDKMKPAKVRIAVTDEMIEKRQFIILDLSFEVLFDEESRMIDLGFDVSTLTQAVGVYMYPKSATTTEFQMEAEDCGYNNLDSLDVATPNFVLKNRTTGLDVTVTAWTYNSTILRYIATYASGVSSGDVLRCDYTGPASGNMYIENFTDTIETT